MLVFDADTPGTANFSNANDLIGLSDIELQIVDNDANSFIIARNTLGLAASDVSIDSSDGGVTVSTPFALAATTTVIANGILALEGDLATNGNLNNTRFIFLPGSDPSPPTPPLAPSSSATDDDTEEGSFEDQVDLLFTELGDESRRLF